LGADLREQITARLPAARITLAGSEKDFLLTEEEGEASVMTEVDEETFHDARVVVLAGSAESSRKAHEILKGLPAAPPVLDLSGTLVSLPEARLRAPWLEPAPVAALSGISALAHPAAIAIAKLLRAAQSTGRAAITVLAPASERGRAGVHELHQQTVQLLSFQPLVKDVFGEQLVFNVLAGGRKELERAIERHVASLLALGGTPLPMPSIRTLQAGVMHGYSFSVWMEEAGDLDAGALDLWPDDPPHVAGIGGQSGIAVGAVERDRNHPRAVWLWAVCDQFRLASDNVVELLGATL